MSTIVEASNLVKHYNRDGFDIPVLDGIDLVVNAGDFYSLMGPSGSGKTTLLNLIGGIDQPTSGRLVVAGEELGRLKGKDLARWRARHIGFIFQLYNLIPVLNAFQNVELPLLLAKLTKQERRKRVMLALEIVGLSDRAKHFPRQLSGGQEQRVAIARAIVSDPTILLADEPTGDLDATSASEILILLKRLNSEHEKTIIMVTHDPHASARASRTVYLNKGQLTNEPVK